MSNNSFKTFSYFSEEEYEKLKQITKTLKEENKNRDFTFIPDEPIRNAREFTKALFAYANKENLDLILLKPVFIPLSQG